MHRYIINRSSYSMTSHCPHCLRSLTCNEHNKAALIFEYFHLQMLSDGSVIFLPSVSALMSFSTQHFSFLRHPEAIEH